MLFINGNQFQPELEAEFLNRAFLHADGFFTTFIFENGKIAAFERHIQRLKDSCEILNLEFPSELETQELAEFLRNTIPNYHSKTYRCRVMVWRQNGLVYSVYKEKKAQFAIAIYETMSYLSTKVHLMPVSIPRIPNACMPSKVKWLAGNNAILAQHEAIKKGGSLALQINTQGFISETPIACIIWFKNGEFFTPSATCDCLPSTTLFDFIDYLKVRRSPIHFVEKKWDQLNSPEWIVLNASWGAKKVNLFNHEKVNYSNSALNSIQTFNKRRMAKAYVI